MNREGIRKKGNCNLRELKILIIMSRGLMSKMLLINLISIRSRGNGSNCIMFGNSFNIFDPFFLNIRIKIFN